MYKRGPFPAMLIRSDGAFVPEGAQEVLDWLAQGNTILPADPPPPPTKDELDAIATKAEALVVQVAGMSPDQVLTYVQQNFGGLNAQQQKFLFVCGVAASFVARRL